MSKIDLENMYKEMLRIRSVEERVANIYPEQEIRCPVHLSIGQEAVAVGVCSQLNDSDYVFSTHRSHAHYLAKGGSLKAMMSELYGKETGCCGGRGGSMHLTDEMKNIYAVPVVGSTIPMAVGSAFGMNLKNNAVAVVFFGEGASEEGVFYESLNYASLNKLPVIFICENNLYSVYSSLEVRQPKARNNIDIAIAHGMEGVSVNGNKVSEVYEAAKKAINKAREKKGPTYIECSTYRFREHCGPNFDDQLGYRSKEEVDGWSSKDPIVECHKYFGKEILEKKILPEIASEIDIAIKYAKESSFPSYVNLKKYVYA